MTLFYTRKRYDKKQYLWQIFVATLCYWKKKTKYNTLHRDVFTVMSHQEAHKKIENHTILYNTKQ